MSPATTVPSTSKNAARLIPGISRRRSPRGRDRRSSRARPRARPFREDERGLPRRQDPLHHPQPGQRGLLALDRHDVQERAEEPPLERRVEEEVARPEEVEPP